MLDTMIARLTLWLALLVPAAALAAASNPLTKNLPPEEICWLEVEGQPVLGLYRKANHGEAKGGALILPGLNNNPASPGLINSLRHSLSENRWHTLVIAMPQGDSEADANQAQQHIAAGIQQLNQQGIFNIALVGQGSGATHAMAYVNQLPEPAAGKLQQIRGIAMVNSKNSLPGYSQPITDAIKGLIIPALDLYVHNDFRRHRAAKQRLEASRQLPQGLYQQLRLPLSTPYADEREERLSKRVRGWLDRHASGFAVNMGQR